MNQQGTIGLRDDRAGWRQRGASAWALSALLIGSYCVLYWTNWLDPVATALGLRHKWFLYGALYTLAMGFGAIGALRRHGNSRYQRIRIAVNVGVQAIFGFTIPFVLPLVDQPEAYLSYFWPLKLDALFPHSLAEMPMGLAVWSIGGSFILAPFAALIWGKRWYCSWICGCGGLANTFGDPWRHLSSRSPTAWRFEQVAVHATLLIALLVTALVWVGQLQGGAAGATGESARSWYGFAVGSLLSGVIGTGLYPLLGPRTWCRYFCPMAAVLGLAQRAGRFRVAVQPGLCIACGNCSTACEMGIDVRAYAMADATFTRASCVGCGMCAHVCPRGVLRIESTTRLHPEYARAGHVVVDL